MITRYLGAGSGFGASGLNGINFGINSQQGIQNNILGALGVEGAILGIDNSLAGRESAEQFAINRANPNIGSNLIANNAQIAGSTPYQNQAQQAFLNAITQTQALAPLAQAAQASGAQNAFGQINAGVGGLLGTQANFNGQGGTVTNSLMGQSILGPELYLQGQQFALQLQAQQAALQNQNRGNASSNLALAGNATGQGQPQGGFFGQYNSLGYQDPYGINSFNQNNSLGTLQSLNGTSQNKGTTRLSFG